MLSLEEKASLLERVINERACTTENDDALFFEAFCLISVKKSSTRNYGSEIELNC